MGNGTFSGLPRSSFLLVEALISRSGEGFGLSVVYPKVGCFLTSLVQTSLVQILGHKERSLWTLSLPKERVLLTMLQLDVKGVLEHLKLTLHTDPLGILLKCRLQFSRSGMGPETLHF